jgi:inhibitor of nuclear factor kappa-B kinase subunit alpha
MGRYSIDERVFMVENYFSSGSSLEVVKAWQDKFPNIKPPRPQTILDVVAKFRKTGSVEDLPPIRSKIDEKFEKAQIKITDLIHANPTLSIRLLMSAVSASIGESISIGYIHKFLREDLHLKPYKLQEYHQLKPPDYSQRVEFAKWLLSLPPEAIDTFICCDEAWFYLTKPVNKQNDRLWSESELFEMVERPLQDEKVLVWCAMTSSKIYGPYFFDSTVNQHTYLEMLETFFWPRHTKIKNYRKYYFQQDGATPHTSNLVQTWLKSKFGEYFLDKSKWPARSPDLNPLDFFLWGYLKSVVYKQLPKTIDQLKANIEQEIEKINKNVLKKTFDNFVFRHQLVLTAEGGHVEDK